MGLLEIASATMRGGERRIEIAAQNTVNAETPGYKAQIAFSEVQAGEDASTSELNVPQTRSQQKATQGAIFDTGETLDLAVDGTGYFLVRDGDDYSLTRAGKFGIAADGALIDIQGRILQLASGGDATTSTYRMEVLPDGTMLDGTAVMGTIGLFEPSNPMLARSLSDSEIADLNEAQNSEIRQAMLERSNVTLSDEMVELMKAQRQVESGAQIIRAYDQLLDRAINTFGRSG
ncbi:flagellar hook-basal body complex protein [uncultured Erythrobacter sp.]|uniref:flagellar hook-basal body complex protein n=1 Tax=uncultured Erythrobacter sp. TaxID=263913 RepID=UPI00261A2A35|nr:flagellar hook-basal body complex protein [uncultured Erythrobacter sp.]